MHLSLISIVLTLYRINLQEMALVGPGLAGPLHSSRDIILSGGESHLHLGAKRPTFTLELRDLHCFVKASMLA